MLRGVAQFETFYLARSLNRLNESVGQGMSGGARAPPGPAEGIAIARTVANELDSAKFDPLLVKAVAKNVSVALEGLAGRMDALVSDNCTGTNVWRCTGYTQRASMCRSCEIGLRCQCWVQRRRLNWL